MKACRAYPIWHCSIRAKAESTHSVEGSFLYQNNVELVDILPDKKYHSQDTLDPAHLKPACAYSPELENWPQKWKGL